MEALFRRGVHQVDDDAVVVELGLHERVASEKKEPSTLLTVTVLTVTGTPSVCTTVSWNGAWLPTTT